MNINHHSVRVVSCLPQYRQAMQAAPMLSFEAERALAICWRDRHDISAASELVKSHLRLVTKIAQSYRGYGLASEDLIGEGHVGLMRAVCRFDPDRGVRFATYAIWWIRTAIIAYIVRNWSLVRTGTTGAQRKLFFNLRQLRSKLGAPIQTPLAAEHVTQIAGELGVPERDVIDMDQRMAGSDLSLNASVGDDGKDEWQSWLVDKSDDPEAVLSAREETSHRKARLMSALNRLSARERHIVTERHLNESPCTLNDLSEHYGLSSERIRQIELRAMTKLRNAALA
jgi:RNA polymerase sigma-32 factor